MVFRADEERLRGLEGALTYLVNREVDRTKRQKCKNTFLDIHDQYGPVIMGYPSWHPLVVHFNRDDYNPKARYDGGNWYATLPGEDLGYQGLDHTIFLAHGFITCPYTDGKKVVESVMTLHDDHDVAATAEILDVSMYHDSTSTVFVQCEWTETLSLGRMIPKKLAVPLMLEIELKSWRSAQLAETWETMRPFFLGQPHGSRSSLFVDQQTGQAMKTIWNSIINTGMFGPIKVG